jgi:ribosomal protein RSM22 (predicted rRNA methylase)
VTGPDLVRAVDAVLEGVAPADLAAAGERLRERYRSGGTTGITSSEAEALAYLATRLPATAEAMRQALLAVDLLMPGLEPSSQLDIGAGPGTAAWAGRAIWPSLVEATLLEHDGRMIRLGKQLAAAGAEPSQMAKWSWQEADITMGALPAADLVTAGYVLGELDLENALAVARAGWLATRQVLVVVLPGTPAAFERIRAIRHELLGTGATVVAPCPHGAPCPIEPPDWCHFAARLERSPLHRSLKGGRLRYEDEKFSYVAFTRLSSPASSGGRVLRHPVRRRRLVELQLCCDDGRIRTTRVGQSKATYREARSLRWGDATARHMIRSPDRPDGGPNAGGKGAAMAPGTEGGVPSAGTRGGAAAPPGDDAVT